MDATTITGVDRVIAISSIAEEELERWYPVSHEQIVRIPHGVDTESIRSGSPRTNIAIVQSTMRSFHFSTSAASSLGNTWI